MKVGKKNKLTYNWGFQIIGSHIEWRLVVPGPKLRAGGLFLFIKCNFWGHSLLRLVPWKELEGIRLRRLIKHYGYSLFCFPDIEGGGYLLSVHFTGMAPCQFPFFFERIKMSKFHNKTVILFCWTSRLGL